MISQHEREANWEAIRVRAQAELEDFPDQVMVVGWKYPEGELIVTGCGVDLLGTLLATVVGGAPVEIRVRLDENGRIPEDPR